MIDFIGLGAQKSGTSWAYACLYEHPEICAPIKEIHFFSRPRFAKGKEWYEDHFNRCTDGKLKGEFSTSYLYSAETPARIKDYYPQAKLIAILRNPVDRAYSQYRNSIKSGEIPETVSFERFKADEKSVLEQGFYAEQLKRYFDLFPKEQLLVLIYEDIRKDPEAFMRGIYQFLGVNDSFKASMLQSEINIARTPRLVLIDRLMHHSSELLRKAGLDRFVHVVRKAGLPELVRSFNTKKVPEAHFDRENLRRLFSKDTTVLSAMLERDLNKEWNIPYEA